MKIKLSRRLIETAITVSLSAGLLPDAPWWIIEDISQIVIILVWFPGSTFSPNFVMQIWC